VALSWLRSLAVLIVPFLGAVLLRERRRDYLAYPLLNRR